MRPLKRNPANPHSFLTHFPLNPEASRTNVSEETVQLATEVSLHAPGFHKESIERDGTRTSQPAKLTPLTRIMLGQFCAISSVSWSWPASTQPGIETGSVVAPDHCVTREAPQRDLDENLLQSAQDLRLG
jgi:hypothetical protein